MSEEILINVTPQETRVALVENGVLQEVMVERSTRRGLVGNIYLGKVSRVLPGMGAAFVEIGLSRTAFLHVSDMLPHPAPALTANEEDTPASGQVAHAAAAVPQPNINALLNEGQSILVQVVKDPIGSKGARLTTQLAIPSRYLVFMPHAHGIGISQRIEREEERERLREILTCHHTGLPDAVGGGYILRTAAEGVAENKLITDFEFVHRLWKLLQTRIESGAAPSLIYEDYPLMLRVLRDLSAMQVEWIRIDSREGHARVREFIAEFIPDWIDRLQHYPGERPILDLYSVEDEIQKALERRVELKSGGHLVIDQTEAMTTIDVNTGGFVGHRNLEETIFKTNLEAAQSIARQLRLRNLGGIIIVDFIDMEAPEHQGQVLRALERGVQRDYAKINISEITSLGLVQITRKRTRESLEQVLCEPCPICHGRGFTKTVETVCYEIFREILREVRQFEAQRLLVVAAQAVVDRMMDEESASLAALEGFIQRPIQFQAENTYSTEQFDVVLQ